MAYMKSFFFAVITSLVLLISCNSDNKKNAETKKDSVVTKKQNKPQPRTETNTKKPPIINIVDTIAPRRIIVYIRDSAANYERISMKLGQIYGVKLSEILKKNALKITGAPMAWYSTHKPPYFFEAGIPVNRKPIKLLPGIRIKEINADSVVMAHFYGPYDLTNVGYEALNEWLKDHKRRSAGAPYEIYITDPIDKKGKPVDPYKVQTDIVFPRK